LGNIDGGETSQKTEMVPSTGNRNKEKVEKKTYGEERAVFGEGRAGGGGTRRKGGGLRGQK